MSSCVMPRSVSALNGPSTSGRRPVQVLSPAVKATPKQLRTARRNARTLHGLVARAAATDTAQSEAAAQLEAIEDANAAGKQRSGASTVSSGIKLVDISKAYKGNELLKGVTWECKKGDRVGLVGVNGAGKTTQLQIVMGNVDADSGEVLKARRNLQIAYLNQEFDINPERTVREELASAYAEGMAVLQRSDEIQKELEGCTDDMDKMSALLDELDKLSNKAVDLDMATLDKRLDKMMPELGFGPNDNSRKVKEYSGGWQMRMCLGKILLQNPDVLLLDEPTNHLDLSAIEWLEGYVKELDIPTVIVSHDREFLDQVCTKIVETERGVATTYTGNYTQYLQQKKDAIAQQWSAYDKWSKEVAKQKDIVRRLAGGGQSGRAASAEKAVARLMTEKVDKPFEERKRSFRFPPVENMGERVATITNLTHGYNGYLLFDDQDLDIFKGDKIAIIGPNGAGKSTLLRLLMGREKPQEGRVLLGEHSIVPNYYEQNQSEALDLNLTVLETLMRAADDSREDEVKALLGRMLFNRAAFEKKVKVLSGGEKARLALAKFMLTKGTLLVLDEPTNHLDIPSKEMLEEAVTSFEGAVIAVSHDRYFLRKIANRVVTIEEAEVTDYPGDYEYYLSINKDEAAKMKVKATREKKIKQSTTKAKSKMSKAQKKVAKKSKAQMFNALNGNKKKKK